MYKVSTSFPGHRTWVPNLNGPYSRNERPGVQNTNPVLESASVASVMHM